MKLDGIGRGTQGRADQVAGAGAGAARLRSKVITQGKHHHKMAAAEIKTLAARLFFILGKLSSLNSTKNSVTLAESAQYRGSGNHWGEMLGRAGAAGAATSEAMPSDHKPKPAPASLVDG